MLCARVMNASPAYSDPGLAAAQAPVPRSIEGFREPRAPHAPHAAAEHTAARQPKTAGVPGESTPGQLLRSTTPGLLQKQNIIQRLNR